MDDALATIYTAHVTVQKLRHDHALAEGKFDHALVYAGGLHYQFVDDMAYPFKPNPMFKIWAPVTDNPYCHIIYTPGLKPKLLYWQPVDYWHKVAAKPNAPWTEKFEIVMIANPDDAKQYVPKGRVAFLGEWDPKFAEWGDLTPNPPVVINHLDFDRAKKTEYEIECIYRANIAGARGHVAAEKAFRDGQSEFEIHVAYLQATKHAEEQLPYGNIIALNEHGSTLHYYHHEHQRFDKPSLYSFLIDAGAQYNGYASDITRTYSRENDEFHELIEAMDAMQRSLVDAVRPNVNYPDIHMLAHQKVGQILADFKFVKDVDAAGAVEKRITSTFLPHGVGHLLGLQVHDVGGFAKDRNGNTIPKPEGHPYLRLTRVVEPSWVFTIEPGLYFVDTLLADLKKTGAAKYVAWDKVDAFRKYGGIRIEDDVVVTETGRDNLTRIAFSHVA